MHLNLRFHTAMMLAAYRMAGTGELNREQLAAVIACCKDSNCETCKNCESIAVMAAQDSGDLTADQANNPKAINWATLIQLIMTLLAQLLPYIVPPAPTPPKP